MILPSPKQAHKYYNFHSRTKANWIFHCYLRNVLLVRTMTWRKLFTSFILINYIDRSALKNPHQPLHMYVQSMKREITLNYVYRCVPCKRWSHRTIWFQIRLRVNELQNGEKKKERNNKVSFQPGIVLGKENIQWISAFSRHVNSDSGLFSSSFFFGIKSNVCVMASEVHLSPLNGV